MSAISRIANSVIGIMGGVVGADGVVRERALTNAYERVGNHLDKMAHAIDTSTGEVKMRRTVEIIHANTLFPHFSEEEADTIRSKVTGMIEERGLTDQVSVDVQRQKPIYMQGFDPAEITLST